MKTNNNNWFGLCSKFPFFVFIFFIFCFPFFFLGYTTLKDMADNLDDITQMYPLDKEHAYVIIENPPFKEGDGTKGYFYYFYPVRIENGKYVGSDFLHPGLWGRQISNKTQVDVSKYLGQPVYIEGEFHYGSPISIKPVAPDWFKSLSPVVLRIDSIELAIND